MPTIIEHRFQRVYPHSSSSNSIRELENLLRDGWLVKFITDTGQGIHDYILEKQTYTKVENKSEDPKITINGWNAPELIFSKLEEAEKVYNYMNYLIDKYHQVSLGDLYSYLNIDFEFSDFRKGWKKLTYMHIATVSKGYKLILPPIKDI